MKSVMAGSMALALVTGCSMEREWVDPNSHWRWDNDPVEQEPDTFEEDECWGCYAVDPTIDIKNARIRGDIGVFRGLDLTVDSPVVYEDPSWKYTNINLTGMRSDGDMGMIFLDVYNAAVVELPEGTSRCSSDYGASGGPEIMVTGCASGDLESEYYDAPATACDVTVRHTPEGTEVSVTAQLPRFDNNGAQVGTTTATAGFLAVPHD